MTNEHILTSIYDVFDLWLNKWDFFCKKGCSLCCTQNVTITNLEAEHIHRFITTRQKDAWFRNMLKSVVYIDQPGQTPNEFAASCLNNESVDPAPRSNDKPCPFLMDQVCAIYEVRPLNCRCFVSQEKCGTNNPAIVPDYILTGSTTVMQIVEHLNQKGHWGNMLDILRLQSVDLTNKELLLKRVKMCRPIPGLLIPPDEIKHIQPLLESIFSTQVDGKSVETILNGG